MQRAPRLRLTFLGAVALFFTGALALSGYTLALLRADAIRNGLEISAMHARSFEDFVTQSLRVTELTTANIAAPENGLPELPNSQRSLLATLHNAPFLRSMSLLDESDRISASSNPANVGLSVATRSYLPVTAGPTDTLRIGQPWAGRDFATGRPGSAQTPVPVGQQSFIALTRRLTLGTHSVKLLAALNPDYFINHIAQTLDPEQGSVEVLRLDGTLLMATDLQAQPGSLLADRAQNQRLGATDSGAFEQRDKSGRGFLTAFHTSSLYPLVVVTHIQRDYALRHWREEVKNILGVVLPALLAIGWLALAFYRRQALLNAQRAESERLLRINAACVFTNAREGIIITAANGAIIDVNDAFSRTTGYSRMEALGQNPRFLSAGRHGPDFYAAMWHDLVNIGHWSGEIWNRRKNGDDYVAMLSISAVRNTQGQADQYVALFSDISAIKAHEHQLEQIAHFDTLTGLPNRRLLMDRLHQALALARRHSLQLAVVFLDLDGFKAINDQHGHAAGDQLLITLAQRMKQTLRDGDTLARLGGDEFVAVLVDLVNIEACEPMVNRLLAAAAEPVQFGALVLQVSASLGVAYYSQANDVEANRLLRQADQAMYQAKQSGKNRHHVFVVKK